MDYDMTPEQVDQFLDRDPGWMILTSLGKDGYPHSVPMGYFRFEGSFYMGTYRGTQKLKNIARNPRVSVLVESGKGSGELIGVLWQGHGEVIAGAAELLKLKREAARLRGVPEEDLPTTVPPEIAYVKVTPHRLTSWDRTKRSWKRS